MPSGKHAIKDDDMQLNDDTLQAIQALLGGRGNIIFINSPITINPANRTPDAKSWLARAIHKAENSSVRVGIFLISIFTLYGFVAHEIGWVGSPQTGHVVAVAASPNTPVASNAAASVVSGDSEVATDSGGE